MASGHPAGSSWIRLIAMLALGGLAGVSEPPHASERISVEMGTLSRAGVSAEGIELTYQLAPNGPSRARLRLDTLRVPGLTGPIQDIELECRDLDYQAATLACQDDAAHLQLPVLGEQSPAVDLRYQRTSSTTTVSIQGIKLAGGDLDLEAEWHHGRWRLFTQARGLDVASLAALVPERLTEGWSASGSLDTTLAVDGEWLEANRVVADIAVSELAFNDATGLRAGEGLNGTLAWRARHEGAEWIGQTELAIDRGQLYIDPVFTDLGKHPVQLTGDAVVNEESGILELLGFRLDQRDVLNAAGNARLSREPPYLAQARLHQLTAQLPAAYTTYGQPLLRSTSAGELETQGRIEATLAMRDGALTRIQVTPRNLTMRDKRDRFQLEDVTGDINWSAGDGEPPAISSVAWQQGSLYGIGVGASRLALRLHGDDVVLTDPASVPVLDGKLLVNQLAIRDSTSNERSGLLDARLEPLRLERLTEALGWPRFKGTLSGRLPSLSYEQGVATLGGDFEASVFGGELAVSELSLRDPLGSLPELTASIELERIDLKALTSAFQFGQITGSLEGRIDDLRLLGWEPAAFRAWFQTPEDDPRRHRISQRAVENLASIGGAGGAAALSRGFLKFFEDFNYRDLGIGCVLREDVCVMRGLGDAGQGYYIVRGKGIPRVDVIGYVNTVSWPTLVEQIRSATASGGPVVE